MNLDMMEWTDNQWDAYYKRTVNVKLEFFELLADAVEMLHQGKRLNKAEQKCWETTVAQCRELIKRECETI